MSLKGYPFGKKKKKLNQNNERETFNRIEGGLMYNVSSFWPFKFLKRNFSSSLSNQMPNFYFVVLSEEEH